MARGVRGSTQAVVLGRACRKCGADEWLPRKRQGKSGAQQTYECLVCNRRNSRETQRARRKADRTFNMLQMAKARAAQSGLAFSLTREDVEAVWPKDGRCPALGIRLKPGTGITHDSSPTLDRQVNEWGYVPGNVRVISHRANAAKRNLTAAELERLAAWMRSNGLS